MKRSRRMGGRGFTLAEILIVIVILAVLASIAMPRFTGQRQKFAAAEAIAIMGSIHRGLGRYWDENGGYPNPALNSKEAIQGALAISYGDPRHGWSFSTDTNGNVTATKDDGSGSLILTSEGAWNGTGQYDPKGGAYWPHL